MTWVSQCRIGGRQQARVARVQEEMQQLLQGGASAAVHMQPAAGWIGDQTPESGLVRQATMLIELKSHASW